MTDLKYLVLSLGDARVLREHLEETTWDAERRELDRMIELAAHHNWRASVPLQWVQGNLINNNLKRCAQFFEVPFEVRSVQVGSGRVK